MTKATKIQWCEGSDSIVKGVAHTGLTHCPVCHQQPATRWSKDGTFVIRKHKGRA